MYQRTQWHGLPADNKAVFREWVELKIIEKIEGENETFFPHVLPHRPIVKTHSITTKIKLLGSKNWMLTDASTRETGMSSLHYLLHKDPNLIA
ncbi:integrase catalytic domain-containing protein [Nephila pilipes]|uniref:Integrase catalytic domain-containing protein n=1 Tax=Nephila pilipes TaxID=299642 RepID=A0A8X6UH81_NEPPI|nr:integrase catalytic domain-containing protein [Nephila pilipes]